jgi:hypothetical protein
VIKSAILHGGKRLMKAQLHVLKSDSRTEEYLHTKVMHTVSRALDAGGQSDIAVAQQLAEVITYFLYNKYGDTAVGSSEILSIIQVALTAVGYEDAAEALCEHHYQRKLKRNRIEVINATIDSLDVAQLIKSDNWQNSKQRWDKCFIIEDLVQKHKLDRSSARTIAGMVEERVFNMGLNPVPTGLIKQLVLSDTAAILTAQIQLQTA